MKRCAICGEGWEDEKVEILYKHLLDFHTIRDLYALQDSIWDNAQEQINEALAFKGKREP